GITRDCIDYNNRAHDAEDRGTPGMTGHQEVGFASAAASKYEQASGRESEEDPVHRHDVVKNLLVAAGEHDDHRPHALQHDRKYRHARGGMYAGHTAEDRSADRATRRPRTV